MLYPSTRLLFTIAHAFAINNALPTALSTVDHVARRFAIPISLGVWDQLFEWTFVLACPRGAAHRHHGDLPRQAVKALWDTMVSPPYNIKPTIGMYNRLICNLFQRQWSPQMYYYMQAGLKLYRSSVLSAYRAFDTFEQATLESGSGPISLPPKRAIEQLRRNFEYRDVLRARNLLWVKRWLRLLLANNSKWSRLDGESAWTLQSMPRILWEWRNFAPSLVQYEIKGGRVEFEVRSEETVRMGRAIKEKRRRSRDMVLARSPKFVGEVWLRDGDGSGDTGTTRRTNGRRYDVR